MNNLKWLEFKSRTIKAIQDRVNTTFFSYTYTEAFGSISNYQIFLKDKKYCLSYKCWDLTLDCNKYFNDFGVNRPLDSISPTLEEFSYESGLLEDIVREIKCLNICVPGQEMIIIIDGDSHEVEFGNGSYASAIIRWTNTVPEVFVGIGPILSKIISLVQHK